MTAYYYGRELLPHAGRTRRRSKLGMLVMGADVRSTVCVTCLARQATQPSPA